MHNKTVWNRLVVPLKPRIELSYLDWKPEDKAPMVGGHNVQPNNMSCMGGPDDFVSSLFPGLPHLPSGTALLYVYPDYHRTASALESFQVSFNLLARVVLGLN